MRSPPPLWGPGGEPEGGFTQPPIPDWVTVEDRIFGIITYLFCSPGSCWTTF